MAASTFMRSTSFVSIFSSPFSRHFLPSILSLTRRLRDDGSSSCGDLRLEFSRPQRRALSALVAPADGEAAAAATAPGKIKIAAISGSLRKASFNSGLVRAAVEIAKEHLPDVEIETLKIGDMPFVNTDLEVDGKFPEVVESFRAKVLAADGFLFACPEYNYSMTAVLKNSIDWASRHPNVWAGKAAAIMSAGGGFGGGRSGYHLRQSGVYVDLHFINKPELFVRAFEPPAKFDGEGNLIDAATKNCIKEVLFALRAWTLKLKSSS